LRFVLELANCREKDEKKEQKEQKEEKDDLFSIQHFQFSTQT
jgi:hypothetical protein